MKNLGRWLLALTIAGAGCECDEPVLTDRVCDFEVAPTDLTFGQVAVGDFATRRFKVLNKGNIPLDNLTIEWRTGTGETIQRQFDPPPQVADALRPSSELELEITYRPIIAVGGGGAAHAGTVTVAHADINDQTACPDPYQVSLLGQSFEQTGFDAGPPDAGNSDVQRADTGFHDAGRTDLGPVTRYDGGFPLFEDGHFEARFAGQEARADGASVQLANGNLVIVGGVNRRSQADNTIEIFAPGAGTPTWFGPMSSGRIQPAIALLADGRVLITGGLDSTIPARAAAATSLEIFDPANGSITYAGDLNVGRFGHSATTLSDGRVVIVGGQTQAMGEDPAPAVAVEIYDPGAGQVISLEVTSFPRWEHTATLLPGDQVLLLGGHGDEGPRPDGEVFAGQALVPLNVTFPLGMLDHSATPVTVDDTFKVLIIGGTDGDAVHTAVWWMTPGANPGTVTVDNGTPLLEGRYGHRTVVLEDQTILVLGGASEAYDPDQGPVAARADATRYVGLIDQWLPLANDMTSRRFRSYIGSMEGGAFVVGGSSLVGRPTAHTNAERFIRNESRFDAYGLLGPRVAVEKSADDAIFFGGVDLSSGRVTNRVRNLRTAFSDLTPMALERADAEVVLLQDGTFLVIGGRDGQGEALRSVEIWNPETGGELTEPMHIGRSDHAAYLLDNGKVLVAGGLTQQADPTDTLELYDPQNETWTLLDARLATGRYRPSLTGLPGGRVLLHGGTDPRHGAQPVDIFSMADNSITPGSRPANARRHHGHLGVRIGNSDNVLFAGGEFFDGAYRATDTAELYNVGSGNFLPLLLRETRRGPAVVPLGGDQVLVAGGNHDTPQDPNTPVQARNSAEVINLTDLQSRLLVPQLTMPRAFPIPISVDVDGDQQGYIIGGLVYDGRTHEDQDIITPLTGMEFSAAGPPAWQEP
jgi:hypothetical protein